MPHLLLAILLTCWSVPSADGPLAYVLDHVDPWTQSAHAAELLGAAGFRVEPLPLDRSPATLPDGDLIFIGSFASEQPCYAEYVRRHGEALREYVEQGNVLVQMTQADQTEASPAFLPDTLVARRDDRDFAVALVLAAENPLLRGIGRPGTRLCFHSSRTIWEGFCEQRGFEVLIAADENAQRPALLEGACGKGRIILAALAIDKTLAPAEGRSEDGEQALSRFRARFLANLAEHVVAVREGRAAAPAVTPPPLEVERYVPGSWTLAVLPDTQNYAQHFPGIFIAQTGWIRQNRDRLDIRYVLQLGDITNNNAPGEWQNARDALALLDGVVPYAVCPGNHDYGPGGNASTRDTLLNEYFPYSEVAEWPTFGGAMEPGRLDNTYHLFAAGGRRWIVIALEWAPRDEVVEWASCVMADHADRTGILITHAYMNNNDLRYDHEDKDHSQRYNPHLYGTPGTKNDGQQLWEKLVRGNDFAITLNGHVLGDGTGYLASTNDRGRTVHQILTNFQMRELGGQGYLRLLEFHPDGKTVQIKTYSPLLDSYLLAPDQQFVFELD